MMAYFRVLVIVIMAVLGAQSLACSSPPRGSRVPLGAPEESSTLGPGDSFRLEIVGEKELPTDYQVASDGTVDLPYIQTLAVAGLEPQEVSRLYRERLISAKILTNPSVSVQVQEYRSKKVTVLGQVVKPGAFPFTAGLTLVQAVSQAGGLNAIAVRDQVRLTRRLKGGKTRTVTFDFEAISSGVADDVPLQSGDRIFVDERVF
jgi:polysaccharide export outer membrane protein